MFKRVKPKLLHFTWDLAYGDSDDSIITEGIDWKKLHIIKNPYKKKKWFADPFILSVNENIIELLVEEFDFEVNKGRIARLVVDKASDTITDCHILLDLDTHLSFPTIYRLGTEIWVHPENSASGKSYIYRYNREKDSFCEKTLLVDAPLTDPIIVNVEGKYVMYATKLPNPNGNELVLYESNDFFGPYSHVRTIVLRHKNARMAGHFIETSTKGIIRPSQDCDEDYGKAVVFDINGSEYGRLVPHSVRYSGLHTFNVLDGIFVIDLKKYDYPLFYRFKENLKWRQK